MVTLEIIEMVGVKGALESIVTTRIRFKLLKFAIGSEQIKLTFNIENFLCIKVLLAVNLDTRRESNSFIKQRLILIGPLRRTLKLIVTMGMGVSSFLNNNYNVKRLNLQTNLFHKNLEFQIYAFSIIYH
jgi:hypothetical protein